jgi:ribosomal-protein-alanine N-acetyltransferase
MVKIVIRSARYLDLKHMAEVNERNLSENYGMEYWSNIFNGSKKHCFVAVFSNCVIGYILADETTIISFAVDEKFRKYGIGKQLISHCLNTFKNDIILHVRVTNEPAIKLYKNFGFVDDHVIKSYYSDGGDGYEMIRKYPGEKYPEKSKFNIPYTPPIGNSTEKSQDIDKVDKVDKADNGTTNKPDIATTNMSHDTNANKITDKEVLKEVSMDEFLKDTN